MLLNCEKVYKISQSVMKSKYFSKCPQMWTDRSDVGMGTSRSLECTFVVIQTTICLRFNTSQPTTFFVLQIGGAWIRLVVCGCSISEFKKPNKWAMAGIWYTVGYGMGYGWISEKGCGPDWQGAGSATLA